MHGMRLTGRLLGRRLRQRAFFVFGMDVLLKLDLAETREFFAAFFALSDFHWQGFLSARLTFPQACPACCHIDAPGSALWQCLQRHGEPACSGVPWMWRCIALLPHAQTQYLSHGPACTALRPSSPCPRKRLCAASCACWVFVLTGGLGFRSISPNPKTLTPCWGRAADRLWPVAVREVQQHRAPEPAAQGPAGAADHAGGPGAHHRLPAPGPAALPQLMRGL